MSNSGQEPYKVKCGMPLLILGGIQKAIDAGVITLDEVKTLMARWFLSENANEPK